MKKKMMLALGLLMLSGCGLTGNKGVSKEQINTDIASKTVKVNGGVDWSFSGDSQRCFTVNDDESKITASNADVSVTVSSYREMTVGNSALYRTLFGKMRLHYKNDGGKWVLENIEPKDLIEKTLEQEEFKNFLDIQMPVCKYFRYTS